MTVVVAGALSGAATVRAQERPASPPPAVDPRVGLKPGADTAGQAAMHMELVSHLPKPEGFTGTAGLNTANSDLAFRGNLLFLGNFHGFNFYDIEDPRRPRLRTSVQCPGGQGDLSVHGNLLFMSVEQTRGRLDCGVEAAAEAVSKDRFRGVRIFEYMSDGEESGTAPRTSIVQRQHVPAGSSNGLCQVEVLLVSGQTMQKNEGGM